MNETSLQIVRHIEKHGSLPINTDAFKPGAVRVAFKSGIIKLNPERDAYKLTKLGNSHRGRQLNVRTCRNCRTVHLMLIPNCISCGEITPYGRNLQKRKELRHANTPS